MSSGRGSSTAALRCATSNIIFSPAMAASRACMDFSLPKNKGSTIRGYTTPSRNGRTGTRWVDVCATMEVSPSFSIMEYLASLEYNPHVPRPTDAGATLQSIRNDSHNTAPCPSLHTDFVLMMDLSTTRLKPLCDRKEVCLL